MGLQTAGTPASHGNLSPTSSDKGVRGRGAQEGRRGSSGHQPQAHPGLQLLMKVPGSSAATVTRVLPHPSPHTQDGSRREEEPLEKTKGHFRGALFSAGEERAKARMISLSAGRVISFHSTGERLLGHNWDKPSYGGEKMRLSLKVRIRNIFKPCIISKTAPTQKTGKMSPPSPGQLVY